MTWLQTQTGKRFSLLEPKKESVDFNEIAYALSHLCRFAGHTKKFYSVAQHCCVVASLLPKPLKIYGLLHDAHEAYIGDIIAPVKLALGLNSRIMDPLESPICRAIHEAAGHSWPLPESIRGAIKYADLVALNTERRDLMAPEPQSWNDVIFGLDRILPMAQRLRAGSSKRSERKFMELFALYR